MPRRDEPNMSDTTLLVSVEDLINMAMGPSDKNVVNFKLIQTVLHILARQMRMLEQRVEIRITDARESSPKRKMDEIKEERKSRSPEKRVSKDRAAKREVEKLEKAALKEKEKAERAASKDRERADRAVSKEREKAEKAAAKERDKADRAASKERDKADRAESKEREKAEKAAAKEKEKAERAASKERDKADRASSKERDKADKAAEKEREKAEKAAAKEKDKADRASSKEREKAEKAAEKAAEKGDKTAAKEKEKAEKAAAKEKEKADKEKEKAAKVDTKEKEKADKAAAKEQEKADKAAAKEKEKAEKMAAKEKEKAQKEKEAARPKSKDRKGKAVSDTSIVVSEVERRKEKVLVVEKGPTTRAERRENIEVVTRSQFDLVAAMVKELQARAGPLPPPTLPSNKKLKDELAKGSASLTDTMKAMQVTARVRAAEKAITRMGELLTALAAAGALPHDLDLADIKLEVPESEAELAAAAAAAAPQPEKSKTAAAPPALPRKSVAIDPLTMPSQPEMKPGLSVAAATSRPSVAAATSRASVAAATSRASLAAGLGRPSTVSKASVLSTAAMPGVSHPEMDAAIRGLRDDLTKTVQNMTTKATSVAENAASSAKSVAEKLEVATKLDNRISTLHSLVSDYAEQLSGFDSGLTTQMSSFRDQMTQMRTELGAGLKQLEQVNNNAETAAVLELTERYEGLVSELDHTMHTHRALTAFQNQLGDELHSLVECVEMLREQKADRDEVLDGLRDKADNSRLAGLLTVAEFSLARVELEKRLDVCHDKFKRQENVWMTALKDLTRVTESKAEITQLLAAREAAELMLLELQDKQDKLAVILGEPKAAMLTRALARGAACGSCLTPALMDPLDASYGAPPPLPAMRPRPVGAPEAGDEEPCMPEWKPPEPPDTRDHTCHRWCGGSHTLLSEAVTREKAPPLQVPGAPTKRYAGYGSDGRLYMLEEELQPCLECNKFSENTPEAAPAPTDGAGDQGPPPPPT